ncbi:MAG: SdpI family protein [Flavobacteriaceae bacterium]|nr:SdpI family protein [Flavobacteriaceae bacterium]
MLESPLFIVPVSTSLICIAAGYYMLKKPPKNINHFYGYRTKKSMKNQENWEFSQKFSAQSMIKWGVIYLFTSILAFLVELEMKWEISLALALMFIFVFIPVIETEKALNKMNSDEEKKLKR